MAAGLVALIPWFALVACVLVAGRAPAALRGVLARVLAIEAAALCRQACVSA